MVTPDQGQHEFTFTGILTGYGELFEKIPSNFSGKPGKSAQSMIMLK